MVLLQKLKALLGLGESETDDREVGLTVERDASGDAPDEPAPTRTVEPDEPAESEPGETVLGEESVDVDDEPASGADTGEPDVAVHDDVEEEPIDDVETDDAETALDESTAAGGSASESTGSITDPDDSPEEATEPAEATAPADDDTVPESEAAAGTTGEEPVDTIKGIGPAYAERLGNAGVETVGDLATADSEELAGETGIAPSRVQSWIDRAKSR